MPSTKPSKSASKDQTLAATDEATKPAAAPTNPRYTGRLARGSAAASVRKAESGLPTRAARRTPATPSVKLKPLLRSEADSELHRYVERVTRATPLQLMHIEREGIAGDLIKTMAAAMHLPTMRLYSMIGVPKATAEQKLTRNQPIVGASGHAAVGIARLLGTVQAMLADSTASQAAQFDGARWLGRWLEHPQPALGGSRPGDLLDTPTGFELVSRSLGAVESGAYL
jgi:uncharacterized protein (DUF2384 family)